MPGPRALVVDFGGVLTGDLGLALQAWLVADDLDPATFTALMREWHGAPGSPVQELETGALPGPDFERHLASRLRTRSGVALEPVGLLGRMFAAFAEEPEMYALLLRARAADVRTALLSNSWGNEYPRDRFDELFDVVVISGEVGLRKPDPEIYRLTAERLGVAADECVFVDDLPPNVRAATDLGMAGVLHRDVAGTIAEVEGLFGWKSAQTASPA